MGLYDREYYRRSPGGSFASPLSGSSITKRLIILNVVVFVVDQFLVNLARAPQYSLSALGAFELTRATRGLQLWRWVTYQFVHAHVWHLVFNMIALYFFGPLMERWWGSRRYLAFYLLCGISGAVLYALLVPFLGPGFMVGASGSIFGILAGAALVAPDQTVLFMMFLPMKLRTLALILMGVAAYTVFTAGPNAGGQAAHLGGAALGFVLMKNPHWLGFAQRPLLRRRPVPGPVTRPPPDAHARRKQEAELDRILTKVKDQGLHSLSEKEKKTLRDATDRQRRAS